MKGAYHRVVLGRRHEAGRQGPSLLSSRSQSGMRAGDDVCRDNGATARGRAPGMESPLLSLPVRDASRIRHPPRRRGDSTRPGARDRVSPPLAPSQGCEQDTTSTETTRRRHEAECRSVFFPPSCSQSEMRAGDDDGSTTEVHRGRTNQEHFRPGRP